MFVDLIFVKQQIFMCALNRRINFCRFNVHVFFVSDSHRYMYVLVQGHTLYNNFTCIACFRRLLSHMYMYMYIVLCCRLLQSMEDLRKCVEIENGQILPEK